MFIIKLLLIHNIIHRQNGNFLCLVMLQMLIQFIRKIFANFDSCKLLRNEL
jgi:hypothetical protein